MNLGRAVCVVTGGTEGIGWSVAERLLGAGARVAICGRDDAKLARALSRLEDAGGEVAGETCDVTQADAVTGFVGFVHQRFGRVSVLVNNAGRAHFTPVESMTIEQFDETIAVNVRGTFLMTRALLDDIRASRGHIVNIASLAGRNAVPGAAAYAAAKHAVLGFSKSLFAEVRSDGVRVTAICPGTVVTPFADKAGIAVDRPDSKLAPGDVAHAVVSVLTLPERALISELDLRPSNP